MKLVTYTTIALLAATSTFAESMEAEPVITEVMPVAEDAVIAETAPSGSMGQYASWAVPAFAVLLIVGVLNKGGQK